MKSNTISSLQKTQIYVQSLESVREIRVGEFPVQAFPAHVFDVWGSVWAVSLGLTEPSRSINTQWQLTLSSNLFRTNRFRKKNIREIKNCSKKVNFWKSVNVKDFLWIFSSNAINLV